MFSKSVRMPILILPGGVHNFENPKIRDSNLKIIEVEFLLLMYHQVKQLFHRKELFSGSWHLE